MPHITSFKDNEIQSAYLTEDYSATDDLGKCYWHAKPYILGLTKCAQPAGRRLPYYVSWVMFILNGNIFRQIN